MFFNTEINKVKEEFTRLKLAPEHRKIVDDVAQIVLEHLEIDPLALKGFVWRAMKKWQMENKMTMAELAKQPKEIRINAVRKITEMTRDSIKKVLKNRSDEELINNVFEKVFEAYVSKWAER